MNGSIIIDTIAATVIMLHLGSKLLVRLDNYDNSPQNKEE